MDGSVPESAALRTEFQTCIHLPAGSKCSLKWRHINFKTQEHSASNTFIYVLSSGGAISVIFVLVIYIILLINFLKYFIFTKNKISNKSSILISCLLMNSFILFRGVTESSFAVFSLDYMLFLISTFIIFSNSKMFNEKIKPLLSAT